MRSIVFRDNLNSPEDLMDKMEGRIHDKNKWIPTVNFYKTKKFYINDWT